MTFGGYRVESELVRGKKHISLENMDEEMIKTISIKLGSEMFKTMNQKVQKVITESATQRNREVS